MHADAGQPAAPTFTMPSVERVRVYYKTLCASAMQHFGSASLAGRWLLVDGLAQEGDVLLIAASIAGAASFVLETRTEAVRHCVRNGIVDCAVTTFDESLHILKNELRKQQPIAVLLEQEPNRTLAAMVECGAQPDMLRWMETERGLEPAAIATMRMRGALPLPDADGSGFDRESDVCWRAGDGGSAVLRQTDLLAAKTLPAEDAERQNWIARAPRYLPRALRLERCVAMNAPECAAFLAGLEERSQQKALAARLEVEAAGTVRVFAGAAS